MPQNSWYERNRQFTPTPNPPPSSPTAPPNSNSWYERNKLRTPTVPNRRTAAPSLRQPTTTQKLIAGGLRTIPSIAGGFAGGVAGIPALGIGAVGGAMAGGAAGSALGEGLAEWYEKGQGIRREFNPAQIATQTALGAVPFLGKAPGAAATARQLGKYALSGAAQGGVLGAASTAGTQLAEGEGLPSLGELGQGAAFGGLFGGATAGALGSMPRVMNRGIDPSLLPADPKVNVVPPVTDPSGIIPPSRQLTAVAGMSPNVRPYVAPPVAGGNIVTNQPPPVVRKPKLLGESSATGRPRFISHPSGKVGLALDPNTPETLNALDFGQTGTQARSIDTRPGDFTNLDLSPRTAWDFGSVGTRKGTEPYPQPRSQGILGRGETPAKPQIEKVRIPVKDKKGNIVRTKNGKIKTKVVEVEIGKEAISPDVAEAMRNRKIGGELVEGSDELDIDQIYATVPNRLRPEVPNVTRLRTLAEGGGKQSDIPPQRGARLSFVSGPRQNWGGVPTTTPSTLKGVKVKAVAASKLAKTAKQTEELLPTATRGESLRDIKKRTTAERLMDSLYADQTVPEVRPQTPLQRGWREGGSDIDDIYFKSTDPNRFDAVRPNRQWKEVTLRDPKQSEINGMLDNGYVIQKKLDNGDVIMRSVEKPPKVKGDLAKPDRFKILNNPTADEIKLHEAQGYSVTERNASGDVTLKYTGVEPAKINTGANQGAAGAAKAESKYSTKKFLKNNPALKSITDRLIKMRSANDLIGKGVRDKFKDVASIPKEKVVEFQKGITEGKHPGVREFFDNLHETVTSRGLDLGKKANYLPQIWDNTEDEIVRALGDKALSERASFQYHSFIQDYEAGIKAGLKPKLSPIELMTNYAQRVNKLIADNEALSALKKNGYVVQENKKTADMLEMDPNLGTFKGYYAHPEVKNAIEGYLQSPETQSRGFGSRLAKGVGKATNLALSSGVVPGRPLFTAHGLNLAAPFSGRSYMEGGIKRNIQALKFGLSPKKATALLEAENEQMVKATQEHGFKANVEDPAAMGGKFFEGENLGKFKKGFNFLSEAQNKYFEGPLFDKMIPALKWTAWKENYAKFIKQGMSEAEAGKNATQITDSFYSGKNLDLIYQSKNSRTAARILLMAPDWLRSTVDLGVKIPKSLMPGLKDFNSPASKAYRAAGARLMGTYVAANLAQYAATGKFMFENAPGDQFNLDFGETLDGQDRKVKLFGNAADFFKIPVQVAQSVASGEGGVNVIAQAVENRVSPLLRLITDFGIVGENFKGEPNIRKTRDNFGNPIPLGQRLKNTASQAINFGPPQFAQPINKATGRAGWEEFMSRIAELPLAYKDKKNPFEYKPPSRTSYEYNLTGRR